MEVINIMSIEQISAKVDVIERTLIESQGTFTTNIQKQDANIADLSKKVDDLNEIVNELKSGLVNTEEGFSNMSSTSIPPTVKALLITLVVYIVNLPFISNKLSVSTNKHLSSNNLSLLIILVVSYFLLTHN
jgi:hypothetical protein